MSRKRRSRTSLQTAAIAAVCVLFVCVTLVGLYRCISQPLTLPDEGTVGPAADLYAVCALLAWALGCLPAAGLSPERGPCRLSPGSLAACPALRGASPAAVRQAAREAMEEFARLLELAADDLRGPDASWTGRQTGVLC